MMSELLKRGELLAREAVQRRIGAITGAAAAAAPDDQISWNDEQVVVRGSALIRRWLSDPGLRFMARSRS